MEQQPLSKVWYQRLKWIAMTTMLIDHFAGYMKEVLQLNEETYLACRIIGRLAFPLFAFLLVESFFFTKDKKRHISRMFLLALISEIPANLVFGGRFLYAEFQNTIFELSIGFVLMCICEWLWTEEIKQYLKISLLILGTLIYCMMSELFSLDYGLSGIILIALLYIAKKKPEQRMSITILAFAVYVIANIFKGASLFYLIVYIDVFLIKCAIDNRCCSEREITKAEILICRWFYPAHLLLIMSIKEIVQILIS